MGAIIGLVILYLLVKVVKAAAGGTPAATFDRLVANGVPARGILLQVSPRGMKVGTSLRRFERRQVYIDIEMPGRPPFETNATPIIPINLVRDVLPGATVELRVDRKNPRTIAIIGPGTGLVQAALRTA